jgi:hypothetical protein
MKLIPLPRLKRLIRKQLNGTSVTLQQLNKAIVTHQPWKIRPLIPQYLKVTVLSPVTRQMKPHHDSNSWQKSSIAQKIAIVSIGI